MLTTISILLTLSGLAVIAYLAYQKFSILASLNIETIQAKKEIRFKEQIISKRLKRNMTKWTSKLARFLVFISTKIGALFIFLYDKLLKIKEEYKESRPRILAEEGSQQSVQAKIEALFIEADKMRKREEYSETEKILIKIIGLDSKNIKAFKLLAQTYFDKKDLDEARQTFEHILKLKDDDEDAYDSLAMIEKERGNLSGAKDKYLKALNINAERSQTYYNLCQVYDALGDGENALKNLDAALKIEPNNPRYLDTRIEMSIIRKDKIAALEAYQSLLAANPDNQKLPEFKKQIGLL